MDGNWAYRQKKIEAQGSHPSTHLTRDSNKGEALIRNADIWAAIVEEEYQYLFEKDKVIPKKTPQNGGLSASEGQGNIKIRGYKVYLENYFGG